MPPESHFIRSATALFELTQSDLPLEEVAIGLLDLLLQETHSDHGSFLRVNPDTAELVILASAGPDWERPLTAGRLFVGQGITGAVARFGKTYVSNDVSKDAAYVRVLSSVKSEACAPIKIRGQVWGVLNVDSNETGHYHDQHISKIEMMAAMVASAIDFRERIQKEKELTKSLVESDKLSAMGQLVAGLAHELNNPLAAIQGTAELFKDNSDPEFGDALKLIRKQARRAGNLVKQLLAFARMEAFEDRSVENIGPVLEDALELIRPQLACEGVSLETWIPDSDSLQVELNVTQIQQVIINLVTNAQQAICSAGIEDGYVSVVMEPGEDRVALRVSDNGPGMEKKTLDSIFTPFFTTKEKGKGTGLGLSITRDIIRDHGGELSVQSQPGEGTSFSIVFPLSQKKTRSAAEAGADRSEKREVHFPNLLIIDDEQSIRWMLNRLFEPVTNRLVIVSSAEEALAHAEDTSFDVVISDFHLPGMDGIEFVETIDEKWDTDSRFILITGDASSARVDKFRDRENCRVVEKPFELKDLLNCATGRSKDSGVSLAS